MKALQLNNQVVVNPAEVASMKLADGYSSGVCVRMRDGEVHFVESRHGDSAYAMLDAMHQKWNEALK